MLSVESYASSRPGKRRTMASRWVRLRLRVQRLANIGANAAELRDLLGFGARILSGLGWLLYLLWSRILRLWYRVYRFSRRNFSAFADWLHSKAELRWLIYQSYMERKSLAHRRQKERAAPLLLMTSAVIMIISGCCFSVGFEVRLDGEHIGYVESREQVEEVIQRVENRVSSYLGAPYSVDAGLSFSMRYMDRTDPLDEDLLEQRLFAAVDAPGQRYMLTVDGEPIGVSRSRTALELMLRRILLTSAGNATQVHTTFVNDVQIVETAAEGPAVTIREMEDKLTQNKQETLVYTIQSGDTVSGIGERYDMKIKEIQELNPGLDPARIHVGQELVLSAAVPYLSVQQTVTREYTEDIPFQTTIEYDDNMYKNRSRIRVPGVPGTAAVVADVTYVNGQETGRVILSYEVLTEPTNAVKVVGTKQPPRTVATGKFIKPSRGRYSSGYGYRPSLGDFHTGVDFAGRVGTPIWAADGGKIIFAGRKGNYGKCVIIDHENGYTTYYAHCSKLLVSKGDRVAKGDPIAKVGNTGRTTGPHLHFEIRYKGKTQNPLRYIKK